MYKVSIHETGLYGGHADISPTYHGQLPHGFQIKSLELLGRGIRRTDTQGENRSHGRYHCQMSLQPVVRPIVEQPYGTAHEPLGVDIDLSQFQSRFQSCVGVTVAG
jgi:hypothetical protein